MKKQDNNQTPRLIRHGYLSNTIYFVPDDLSLTICVDPKKEKHPRKRKPTKARLAQIQEDKENIIRLFQQNQSDLADAIERKEHYFYDFSARGKDEARLGIPQEELNNRYEKWAKPSRQYRNFAEEYDLDMDELRLILAVPRFLHVDYRFSSLEELLSLEFTKMLDLNLRYTKCRRCGRLFPLKGNREAKYCENIAEGEMKTCRELAIQENYKAKTADKPERKIYNKYYKRYSARVKTGQITEEKFREWKYTAMTKRDECTNGKISVDELEAWMEESFTNRKKIG